MAGERGTTRLLLLGTVHMSNPRRDFANVHVDDVLRPARQRELEAVARCLLTYRPTKIAVEHDVRDVTMVERYDACRDGRSSLAPTEQEQVGFRVARAAGHDRVYPIDAEGEFYDERVEAAVLRDDEDRRLWDDLAQRATALTQRLERLLATGTWLDVLRELNAPRTRREAHALYLTHVVPLGAGIDYVGAEMVANWYRRNLKIFANLRRICERGDRILVIYGYGHVPVLEHLADASPEFALDEAAPVLATGGAARA